MVSRDDFSAAILHRDLSLRERPVNNLIIRLALKRLLGDRPAIKTIRGVGEIFVGIDTAD